MLTNANTVATIAAMKSGLKATVISNVRLTAVPVATIAAMKSGLKAVLWPRVAQHWPVATIAAMKSGLKAYSAKCAGTENIGSNHCRDEKRTERVFEPTLP